MSLYENIEVERAVSAARESAMAVGPRPDLPTLTPGEAAEQTARERLQRLGQRGQGIAPSAAAAEALIAGGGCRWPVPLDPDTLRPTGGPFKSYAECLQHWMGAPGDGVGVELGSQPGGGFMVAVRAAPHDWLAWRKVHASTTYDRGGEDGGPGISVEPRFLGYPSTASWAPPATGVRQGAVVTGAAALLSEADSFIFGAARQTAGKVGWLAWAVGTAWQVPAPAGKVMAFTDRRLDHGVEVVTSGPLPVHVRRPDGWALSLDNLPVVAEMPSWLADELGGKLVKT